MGCSLELPMLQQRLATFGVVTEDMGMEDMVDTVDMVDMDIMERDLLKLMPSQDTSEDMAVMVTAVGMVMEVTVMDVDTMERGRLKLSPDILEDTVVMVVDMDMVVTDMVDSVITVKFLLKFSSLPKDTIHIVLF